MTAASVPPLVAESRAALAVALCADPTWEHHDQTDDHPCTRCKRQADALLASGVVTTAEAHREDVARALYGAAGLPSAWVTLGDGQQTWLRLAAVALAALAPKGPVDE